MIVSLFLALFSLMTLGMAVYAAMALAAVLVLVFGSDIPLSVAAQSMVTGVDANSLIAIPFYMLAGDVMTRSGITKRLVEFSKLFVGHLRGGLAYVAVLADVFAAGISGSAVADASATGAVLVPAMKKAGYKPEFSAAINASASMVGPVIPPSIPMIVMALIANLSVGKLFLGGLVPGLLMSASLLIALGLIMRKGDFPPGEPVDRSFKSILTMMKDASLSILAPIIIVLGIFGGLVTIVEASILAAAYVLLIGMAVYRTISIRDLPRIFIRTSVFSSTLLIIFAAIGPFSAIMVRARIGQKMASLIDAMNLGRLSFLLMMVVVFIILGMVMDGLPIIVLFLPILIPAGIEVGVDPIHLSIVLLLVLMIGLMTPPMGALLFVMARIGDVSFQSLVRASFPFVASVFVVLMLVVFFEGLVLFPAEAVFGP